jgi:hypothetical protein
MDGPKVAVFRCAGDITELPFPNRGTKKGDFGSECLCKFSWGPLDPCADFAQIGAHLVH